MIDSAPPKRPRHFDFLLVPRFSLLTFASAVEPLRIANWITGRELYSWRLLSRDGNPVRAANDLPIPVETSIELAGDMDTLLVCASLDAHTYFDKGTLGWLRQAARRGTRVGGLGAGGYLLARAGLLKGTSCALHWQEHEAFAEMFPDIDISQRIFEVSGNRFTCAGGTATIDFMLHLILQDHGRDFAGAIAEQFLQSGIRSSESNQRMSTQFRLGVSDRRIVKAIDLMQEHISRPLTLEQICRDSGISMRHIQRRFQEELNCTPQSYYLQIRLRFARQLLLHSESSIIDVAIACGFVSASHFCRTYKSVIGHAPSVERKRQTAGMDTKPATGRKPPPAQKMAHAVKPLA